MHQRRLTGQIGHSDRKPYRGRWACPWIAACLGLGVGGLAGCGKPRIDWPASGGRIAPEESMEKVVGRVNANSAWMNFVLESHGEVQAQHIKSDGKPEPFSGTVNLLFRKPRDLNMKMEHTLGETVMQIGSNGSEFWVWKRVNEDVYWWGRHAELDPAAAAELPIRPDQLVEVMGISNLPTRTDPRRGPRFEVKRDHYELTFLASDAGRRLYPVKRIKIDRRKPYLVCGVEFLSPAGRQTAVARLGAYGSVPGTAVMVPYRVRIDWPARGEFLDMDFNKMERYEKDAGKVFFSPRQLGRDVGREIRVDHKPASSAGLDEPSSDSARAAG